MTSLFTALYTLALLTQMYVISVHLPVRVVAAIELGLPELDEPRDGNSRLQRYLNRNRFVAVLGLVPMLVAWLSDFERSLTLVLLTTGLYFFLQVGALFFDREVRSLFSVGRSAAGQEVSDHAPVRFSRALVIAAVAAYVVYVAASVIYQNEATVTLWAKIQIVTLANFFFVVIIAVNLIRMRRASTEESRILKEEIGRSINVLAVISLGISAYFFGKDVLLDLDLAEARPLMMSVFLQALAVVTVHAQLGTSMSKPTQGTRHGDDSG